LSELIGSVSRSTVQEVIKDVAWNYEGAHIQAFVPIFIRRDAIIRLRVMLAEFELKETGMNEAGAGIEVV